METGKKKRVNCIFEDFSIKRNDGAESVIVVGSDECYSLVRKKDGERTVALTDYVYNKIIPLNKILNLNIAIANRIKTNDINKSDFEVTVTDFIDLETGKNIFNNKSFKYDTDFSILTTAAILEETSPGNGKKDIEDLIRQEEKYMVSPYDTSRFSLVLRDNQAKIYSIEDIVTGKTYTLDLINRTCNKE